MLNSQMSRILLFAFAALFIGTGCSVTRNFRDGEKLLVKNTVHIKNPTPGLKYSGLEVDEIPGLIQQKPNKKLLGIFRFGLWVYRDTTQGKVSKFTKWINRNLAQYPEILDKYLVDRSVDQISLYLNNCGFFNSQIDTSITIRRKKAVVDYSIYLAKPYKISAIQYQSADSVLKRIVLTDTSNSLVKKGAIYNVDALDDERYRLTSHLRNNGYFFFSPDYIYFEIDSAFSNKTLKVNLKIEQLQIPVGSSEGEFTHSNHRQFFVKKILINPDFSPIRANLNEMNVFANPDTTSGINRYEFFYLNKLKIRPRTIRNSIFLEPLKLYGETAENNTYRQLTGYPLFGYATINFDVAERPAEIQDTTKHWLNCRIDLVRRKVQSFSVETEGTNSGGKLGVGGNFIYQNLNIFRGGEVLTMKLTGGVEWQQGGEKQEDNFLLFSTLETGAEISLDFPKFLLPVSQDRIPKTRHPKTSVRTGVNIQDRPDYLRYITNISFGYQWKAKQWITHNLIPLDINSVSIFPDSSFVSRLEKLNDPRLKNQYSDHFIMAARYSYTYNNQERNKIRNFTYFRWNIESAGNVLSLTKNISETTANESGQYTVWGIPFAQYLRSDLDFRKYFALGREHTIVYRNLFGAGAPYGNSDVLPFEKGFYAGGSSDMRGWRYRSLGPGSFEDTSNLYYEKMGDIILEANLEYRFPVYSIIKGALFADFGNIWLLNNSENYPGGRFNIEEVLNEIAMDAGLGLRLDLTFFIFRIDAAAPLRNPAFPKGDRWRFNSLAIKDVIWNFGIGYPF